MSRVLLICCGWIFIALAVLGVVLPILPTTPFILVAATCFTKSSPALYQWLLRTRLFGPLITNWKTNRTISKRAKMIALGTIAVSACWSVYILPSVLLKCLVVALLLWPVQFIWRIKEVDETRGIKKP